MVLSTDVSVVGHMLKGGRGALFRIPANAMQLKGRTGLLPKGVAHLGRWRGKKKKLWSL